RAARALVALAAYRRGRPRAASHREPSSADGRGASGVGHVEAREGAVPGTTPPRSRGIDRLIAPLWRLPPDLRRHAGWMWVQPRFFEALGGQIGAICESAAEVAAAELPDVPLVVLAAGDATPERLALHRALAARAPNGRLTVVDGSGHWIPLERPDAVVAAIREVLSATSAAADVHPSRPTASGAPSADRAGA
ncbi:MAG TPA: hypothetical protein VNI83_16180, partial [Vicinamibacterales bacterium]|nr:hypothetical protein [Vicinamibacterales bacterium]